MSSLRERLALAIRVFRADPDEVVTLTERDGGWSAEYRGATTSARTEAGALGELSVKMKLVRDRSFRDTWMELVGERERSE